MRTTITIDDELVAEASELSGIRGNRALVHHGSLRWFSAKQHNALLGWAAAILMHLPAAVLDQSDLRADHKSRLRAAPLVRKTPRNGG